MTRKQRRASFIGLAVGILGLSVFLVLYALRDTVVFFHTPKEVVEKQISAGKRIRLGGLVAEGSLRRGEGLAVCVAKLDALSPLGVLTRGYSITEGEDGRIIRDASTVARGEKLKIRLERGKLNAEVLSSEKDDG